MATRILMIAAAGAAGTLARYWLAGVVQRASGGVFPWGTFSVNIIGSFLFGLIWALAEERMALSPQVRIIALGGFMGAFTTFSTFMFETGALLRDSQFALAAANIALQNVMGVVFLLLGLYAARAL